MHFKLVKIMIDASDLAKIIITVIMYYNNLSDSIIINCD